MKQIELYNMFMVRARVTDKNIQIAQMGMSRFVQNASHVRLYGFVQCKDGPKHVGVCRAGFVRCRGHIPDPFARTEGFRRCFREN